jgi:phospholipase/carboxylesterase
MAETELLTLGKFMLRQRLPPGPGPYPLFFLLHGWTGDEDSMWIFTQRLPKDALMVAPRGQYPTPLGGYAWHPIETKTWSHVDEFRPAVQALLDLLTPQNFPSASLEQVRMVGFSQGAALAYTFALLHPERVHSIAGLSGFVPDGAEALIQDLPLKGMPVFMAHGLHDVLVPIERARQARDLLIAAGADLQYCEHDAGHKLNASCFREVGEFFSEN